MRRTFFLGLCALLLAQLVFKPGAAPAPAPFVPASYKTFESWKAACDRLPSNRALKGRLPPANLLPLKSFAEFERVVDAFAEASVTGELANAGLWVGRQPTSAHFFNTNKIYYKNKDIPFEPFAQKLLLPAGSEVVFRGDLHGDLHSLIDWMARLNTDGFLEGFKVKRPNAYVVLLGDYTDRGMYGVEVLYTLYRLKLENPDRVFLLRGNHEDLSLARNYGFLAEGQGKYGASFNAEKVLRVYDFMPVAIYLGCGTNLIQCCHGGMEPGYDPRRLLGATGDRGFQMIGQLNQEAFVRANPKWPDSSDPASMKTASMYMRDFQPESPVSPSTLGFMWNDFSVARGEQQFFYDVGRAFVFGDKATSYVLDKGSTTDRRIRAVFRAHQHSSAPNAMMRRLKASKGIFRHWQAGDTVEKLRSSEAELATKLERGAERSIPEGSVWTFNVGPDSVYGEGNGFDFDTYGILKLTDNFADWKMQVVNVTPAP